uniref:Uncharacterized protein n=1 Tax=Panagrolaimus superbus TaxID=310955 RepID=A0A914Y1A8_9BILA
MSHNKTYEESELKNREVGFEVKNREVAEGKKPEKDCDIAQMNCSQSVVEQMPTTSSDLHVKETGRRKQPGESGMRRRRRVHRPLRLVTTIPPYVINPFYSGQSVSVRLDDPVPPLYIPNPLLASNSGAAAIMPLACPSTRATSSASDTEHDQMLPPCPNVDVKQPLKKQ